MNLSVEKKIVELINSCECNKWDWVFSIMEDNDNEIVYKAIQRIFKYPRKDLAIKHLREFYLELICSGSFKLVEKIAQDGWDVDYYLPNTGDVSISPILALSSYLPRLHPNRFYCACRSRDMDCGKNCTYKQIEAVAKTFFKCSSLQKTIHPNGDFTPIFEAMISSNYRLLKLLLEHLPNTVNINSLCGMHDHIMHVISFKYETTQSSCTKTIGNKPSRPQSAYSLEMKCVKELTKKIYGEPDSRFTKWIDNMKPMQE